MSLGSESNHLADAMCYALMARTWPPPIPQPWLVRLLVRQSRWIAARLYDLADWFDR